MKKAVIWILVILILAAGGYALSRYLLSQEPAEEATAPATENAQSKESDPEPEPKPEPVPEPEPAPEPVIEPEANDTTEAPSNNNETTTNSNGTNPAGNNAEIPDGYIYVPGFGIVPEPRDNGYNGRTPSAPEQPWGEGIDPNGSYGSC